MKYDDFDEIAEIMSFVVRRRGLEIKLKQRRLYLWMSGKITSPHDNSLAEAAVWCGLGENEVDYLKRGIKKFVRKVAEKNPRLFDEARLYRIVGRNANGDLDVPDWEQKVKIAIRSCPHLSAKTLDRITSLDIAKCLGINKQDVRGTMENFRSALSKSKKQPVPNIVGTWEGWSIYPIEPMYKQIFCYKVTAEFIDQIDEQISVKETLIKLHDLLTKTEFKEKIPLEYSGTGFIHNHHISATVRKDDPPIVWSHLDLILFTGETPYNFREMKGFVTIFVPGREEISLAAMKLRRVGGEGYTSLSCENVASDFDVLKALSKKK